jgi:hypothetical protein
MNKIILIGNGFDLHHGLKTHYSDFHKYISQYNPELECFFEDYFNMETDENYLWKDFESDLGTFDSKSFFDDRNEIDPMADNF